MSSANDVELNIISSSGKSSPSEDVDVDIVQMTENYSLKGQFKAMAFKTVSLQKRDYKTNCFQCLMPIAMICVVFLLQKLVDSLVGENTNETIIAPLVPPYQVLSEPIERYVPPSEMLWTQSNPDINTNVTQLLSLVPTTNYTVIFIDFDENIKSSDIDKEKKRINGTQGIFRYINSRDEIDNILYEEFEKDPKYTAAYEFVEMNTVNLSFVMDFFYNDSLTRGADLPGAISQITIAISRYIATSIILSFKGVYQFPTLDELETFDVQTAAGPFFYVIMLMMIFPVFLANIVYEKEHRQREIMKMMGLKMPVYWTVQYLFDYLLYILVFIMLIIGGFIFRFRFFTINAPGVYILLFLIWGNILIASAFFLSSFFTNSRTATVVGYFSVIGIAFFAQFLISPLVGNTDTPSDQIFALSLFPPFALYRGLTYLSLAVQYNGSGIKTNQMGDSELNMGAVFGFLIIEWLILMFLAYYFDQVYPDGQGIKRHPLFLFHKSYWCKKDKRAVHHVDRSVIEVSPADDGDSDGPDVIAEKKRVEAAPSHRMIKIMNLRKVYKGTEGNPDKIALKGLTMGIDAGTCLGILGHNGAGKTTLINMLCGFFPPTSGTADIFGLNINEDIDDVHMIMGVCPQHDVLWDTLTGEETLLFYGRLKNLSGKALDEAVKYGLESVRLTYAKDRLTRNYSGGMKRRLSVAVSLMGRPKVIFLDEPSTGLDPKSKQTLWEVVNKAKQGAAVILTTHSMEEAEALCDKIAVFSEGRLKCIGPSADLKKRFGAGFRLSISIAPGNPEEPADQFVKTLAPGAELLNSLAGTRNYTVSGDISLARIFNEMENNKATYNIRDWGISNTTLEEVFIGITMGHIVNK